MVPVVVAFTTFIATLMGGLVALKNRDKLHHILGFSAGVLLGVVAFDLLPEIFELAEATGVDPNIAMITLVTGFMLFHIIEKVAVLHTAHKDEYNHDHGHPHLGQISAAALAMHSFFDGVGIGLAFQLNSAAGIAVAIAVISHDFADGINTVGMMLRHRNTNAKSLMMLMITATAPVLGALSTTLFQLPDAHLVAYLGFFAGFLFYISSSDILPEAHANHPSKMTLVFTILGVCFIYFVSKFIEA